MQALISNSVGAETSRYFPIMLQLSHFLRYCGLTYLGLITGHEVDMAIDLLSQGRNSVLITSFMIGIWHDLIWVAV